MRDRLKVMLTRYPHAYDAARRPYAVARFALRQPHDSDYKAFDLFPTLTGDFLDVGANAGMSALSFRIYNKLSPIISIEANPFHEKDLRFVGTLAKPFNFHMLAAGREDGELPLYTPVYRGVPLTTEASLIKDEVSGSGSLRARLGSRMDSEDFDIVTTVVPVRKLDTLALSPDFIKLDVQGAEYDALLGLAATLRNALPVLLIETPDTHVRDLLDTYGYTPHTYLDSENRFVPEIPGYSNTLFLHPRHLSSNLRSKT